MRVKQLFLTTAITILALTSTSYAADVVAEAPEAYNWSGFYAGVVGGYSFGNNNWEAAADPGSGSNEDSLTGASGGLTLGYNVQGGSWVYGAEADISVADISALSTTSGTFNCSGTAGCATEVSWLGTVRGRVGYVYGSTLPYITGGLAFGKVKASVTGFGTLGEETKTGFAVGAGVEHAFSNKISAKLEYLYTDLGTLDIGAPCAGSCETDVNFSTIRVGLNYKF